jgi:PGF-pre-PGF domain-containing protein
MNKLIICAISVILMLSMTGMAMPFDVTIHQAVPNATVDAGGIFNIAPGTTLYFSLHFQNMANQTNGSLFNITTFSVTGTAPLAIIALNYTPNGGPVIPGSTFGFIRNGTDGSFGFEGGYVSPDAFNITVPASAVNGSQWTFDIGFASMNESDNASASRTVIAFIRPANISGTKFNDLNHNGSRDVGEPGLQGWAINLTNSTGAIVAQTTTDINGKYTFTFLPAGNYTLSEVQNVSWTQTYPLTGVWNVALDGTDKTGLDFGNFLPPPPPAGTIVVPLSIDPSTNRTNTTVIATSPLGNMTLTISNGTQAIINGTPITNISLNSTISLPTNESMALSANNEIIGEIVNLGPARTTFDPPIQVRFNYTVPLPSGFSEDNLQVMFFNANTSSWESLPVVERNKVEKYIIANVSHFSTFALLGTVVASSSSGGGGEASGGSGVVSSEPYTNIEKAESYDNSLIANISVMYAFKALELSIYEIAVIGKETENDITLRVEALKGTSRLATVSPPGIAYKNVNIWAGTKNIKEDLIKFKVDNSWLDSKNLEGSDIKMVKWDGNKWAQIETIEETKDSIYTYYEAKTDTFSVFAITGLKGEAVPTATPAIEVTETPSKPTETTAPSAEPTKKASEFEFALTIAVISAVYLFWRKRR